MRRNDILRPANRTIPPVRREDHDRRDRALQRSMQIRKRLDVQHVDFVDEQNAGNELGDSLIDVFVDDFIYLPAKLVGDFRFLRLHQLAHHGHDVLAALRAGVRDVEVVEGDVLDDFFFLVNVAFRQRDVFFGFEVEFGGVDVGAALAFDCAAVCFDVDDVTDFDLFFLERFVDGWV